MKGLPEWTRAGYMAMGFLAAGTGIENKLARQNITGSSEIVNGW